MESNFNVFIHRYSSAGSSSCISCAAGSYCLNGIKKLCPAGTYQPALGQTTCIPCPDANYCLTGSVTPTLCADGLKAPANSISATDCTACDKGNYCLSGKQQPCMAGTYQPTTGQTTCLVCVAGFFCPAGSINPTACLDSKTSNSQAQSSNDCFPCPAGATCLNGAVSKCAAGTYALVGQTSCTICPAGSYCLDGASTNTVCPDGKTSVAGAVALLSCYNCPAGSFCVGGKVTACSAGTYSQSGQISCLPCPAGSFCVQGCSAPSICADGRFVILIWYFEMLRCY